jgi:hypothetical protein
MKSLRRFTLGLAWLLALIAIPIYALKIHHLEGHADFNIYWRAARDAAEGRYTNVYAYNPLGDTPFRYGPPSLLLFRPFALLPLQWARDAWFAFQCICIAGGFAYLHRAIQRLQVDATWITAATFLYVLRFCLDNFTIGQVSGVMFLAFAWSLDAWIAWRPGVSGTALSVPSILKVSPVFNYAILALGGRASAWRATWSGIGALGAYFGVTAIFCGSFTGALTLWREWVRVVMADSQYFDSSHYGSQSIKSALLRMAKAGWLSPEIAHAIFLALMAIAVLGVLWLAWKMPLRHSPRARAIAYALGISVYLGFMPETFKYSLPFLAIPVSVLLGSPKGRLEWGVFGFGALTLSLAGLDIVGPRIFFGLQYASIPALAITLIGLAVYRQGLRLAKEVAP